MGKFAALEALATKGYLEDTKTIDGVKYGYKTLNSEEEKAVYAAAMGSPPHVLKIETLVYALTHIDGQKISDDLKERDELRKHLNALTFDYIVILYAPYGELMSKLPELTRENVESPLEKTQQSEAFTKLS